MSSAPQHGWSVLFFVSCLHIAITVACSASAHSTPNIIRNGSFELGMQDWSCNTRGDGPGGYPVDIRLKSLDLRPEVAAASDAPHGHRVLYYHPPVSPNSKFIISSRPYQLKPGHYTLSAALDVESGVALEFANEKIEIGPTRGWKRVRLDVVVGEGADPAAVQVTGREAGGHSYRLDDFWLTCADHHYPKYPAEVGLTVSAPDQVFFAGDAKVLTIRAVSEHATSGRVHYRIENAWGEKTSAGELALELRPGEVVARQIPLDLTQPGHYRVFAEFETRGRVQSYPAELLFAVLPDRELPDSVETGFDSRFGCHMEARPRLIELAQKIGVRWVFCNPPLFTKWFSVEPRPGEWEVFDEQLQMLHDAGIHVVGVLADAPFWATVPGDPRSSGPWPNNRFPANWADWDEYVRFVVRHYRAWIGHWALWNEPDHPGFLRLEEGEDWVQKYRLILERTYDLVKRVDPDARLVGGTVTNPASLTKLLAAGAGHHMDIGAFHWSSWTPQGYVRHTAEERGLLGGGAMSVARMREVMAQTGKTIPIWDTEMHCTQAEIEREFVTQPNPAKQQGTLTVTRLDAAAAVPRMFIAEWAAGVAKSFYWLLADITPLQPRADQTLLEWDRSPSAALVTFAATTGLLGDAEFVRWEKTALDTSSTEEIALWVFYFKKPAGRMRVVWTNSDTPQQVALPLTGKLVGAWDMFGARLAVVTAKSGGGRASEVVLSIDRNPVYLLEEE